MPTNELARGAFARRASQLMLALMLALPLSNLPARGQQTFLLGGRVEDGGSGVSNVTVQAVGQSIFLSATTDANGVYGISLPVDTYTVTASKENIAIRWAGCLTQSDCTNSVIVTISPIGPDQTNINFAVVYDIGGQVTEGTTGLGGVQLSVQDYLQTGVTDANGRYTLPGFRRGNYTVTPTKTSYTFDPTNLSVTVAGNVTNANFTAHARFAVSGRVLDGRTPLPGVSVVLRSSQATLNAQSDANGNFVFSDLVFATYTVTPSLASYAFNPPSLSVSGQTNIVFLVATASVSGRVTEGTNGLASVEVDAISATATNKTLTDLNGYYTFGDLAGTFTIMPSAPGQSFNPARRTLSAASAATGIDFEKAPTAFDALVTTCDFPSLQLALSAGGTVGFDCGDTADTITIAETVSIATNVVLEGAGATLSGGNAVRLFTVNPAVSFTLKNLTLTGGHDAGDSGTNGSAGLSANGGAIYNDGGTVTMINCTNSGHIATGGTGGTGVVQLNGSGGNGGGGGGATGGAIYNAGGVLLLTNCLFRSNAANGGAGGNGAAATAGGNGNHGGSGGAGGSGTGGAIYNGTGGTVVAYDCTFASNTVSGATGGAGGIGTGLGSNGANGSPGAGQSGTIYNDGGNLTVLFSAFYANKAVAANGGNGLAVAGEAKGTSGTSGGAAGGGAIYNQGGSLAATNSTFDSNSVTGGLGGNGGAGGSSGFGGDGGAGGSGGGGDGGGICNAANGTSVLVNCTINDNSAQGGAGGTGGAAGSTFARSGSDGQPGADFGGGIANISGILTLKNTLLAASAAGGNGAGVITDGGHNLSDDASIVLTASGSSTNSTLELGLGLPGNNGGPTLTVPIISSTSVAVDAGDDTVALPIDQRHFARSGRSDIGAFEFNGSVPVATLNIRRELDSVVLSWAAGLVGYALESKPDLSLTTWIAVTNASSVIGNQFVVTNSTEGVSRFYRLSK